MVAFWMAHLPRFPAAAWFVASLVTLIGVSVISERFTLDVLGAHGGLVQLDCTQLVCTVVGSNCPRDLWDPRAHILDFNRYLLQFNARGEGIKNEMNEQEPFGWAFAVPRSEEFLF